MKKLCVCHFELCIENFDVYMQVFVLKPKQQKEVFHLLVHFPNTCSSQAWPVGSLLVQISPTMELDVETSLSPSTCRKLE